LRKEKEEKPIDLVSLVEREESEKHKKYLEEDQSKPREKRREMSKDELNDWMLEDQAEAVAWINRREIRREIDKRQNLAFKQRDGATKKLLEGQFQSLTRVYAKHPELDIRKRKEELKNQGKSEDEIENIIRGENKKYSLIIDIAEENPDWKFNPKAPELVAEEMEKRLKGSTDSEEKTQVEKLQEQVEALSAEIARITSGDEGITSTIASERKSKDVTTEAENALIETMRKAKASQAMIDSAVKKFREKNKK
jgi:O6-methylguanine-DNA--protein-cysteine methyltransferase